jgi:hypothetical protein
VSYWLKIRPQLDSRVEAWMECHAMHRVGATALTVPSGPRHPGEYMVTMVTPNGPAALCGAVRLGDVLLVATPPPPVYPVFSSSVLLSSLELSDKKSMSLKHEPASEPLHIYVKKLSFTCEVLGFS